MTEVGCGLPQVPHVGQVSGLQVCAAEVEYAECLHEWSWLSRPSFWCWEDMGRVMAQV